MAQSSAEQRESAFERFGLWLAAWSEKWFPDAWVFALIGIVVVFVFGVAIGESPAKLAIEGGKSFWVLIPFTMQMAMIIIGGYVVASSPGVYYVIQKVAGITTNPRAAIAWIAFFSMTTSLVSWGFSLIFSALLAREMSRTIRGMDYRAAGAAAYLGLGAVWALGLSSSAAQLQANPASMPQDLLAITGVLPFTQTILLWQSLALTAALIATSMAVAWWSA